MAEPESSARAGLEAVLARAIGGRERVRLQMHPLASDPRDGRVIEGHALEIAVGRDNRKRVRVGIPAGSGDPVEVRVLLDGIERVEVIEEREGAPKASSQTFAAVRRPTLTFGDEGVARPATGQHGKASNDPSGKA